MTKYFISGGVEQFVSSDLIEADSLEEAEEYARTFAFACASSYGFEQDFDRFGDYDQVVREEEGVDEEDWWEGFVEYIAEEYNPDVHDGELY